MNTFKLKHIATFALFITLAITACEDEITVDSGFETPQLVVDAWITNEPTAQTIVLSQSQDYFDNRLPDPVLGATVEVIGATGTYSFADQGNGNYVWTPGEGQGQIGTIGEEFILNISTSDITASSSTTLNRVPEIDSIRIFEEDDAFGSDSGLFAELYVTDLPGKGDTYWARSSRNDTLLNRPQEINIIYDATFDSGTDIDGTTFIRPLRFAINAVDDEGFPRELNIGDKVGTELYSISNEAFQYLQIVQEQTTNGDNSIFALPVANSRGNIRDQNGELVLGVFNVAAVSRLEVVVE